MSNTALEPIFKSDPPAPSSKLEVLQEYFPAMEKALKHKGVTREQLWRKYIEEHPDGYRLSQFKEDYRRWKKVSNGTMHIDNKTGEKTVVDAILDRLVHDVHRMDIEGDSKRKNRKIKNM
jgi:transposase